MQVVGRKAKTAVDEANGVEPKAYRMKLFAPNEIIAKSRFWYFMHQVFLNLMIHATSSIFHLKPQSVFNIIPHDFHAYQQHTIFSTLMRRKPPQSQSFELLLLKSFLKLTPSPVSNLLPSLDFACFPVSQHEEDQGRDLGCERDS
jgi:hypothetical protein